MKIDKQFQEDHQVKITVEVEPEQMESMKRRSARKIARRVKIPGFRPGKAPYAVIVRQVGEAAIIEDALELLVNDIYPKVIEEADINPYGPGSLENVGSLDPPTLEFVVPLEAEVVLGDYRSLRRPYEPEPVKDEDIQDVLDNIRERQAVIEPVERAAKEGDLVTVRISAKRTQVNDGDDDVLIKERSLPLIVNTSKEDVTDNSEGGEEWPYPGFSSNIIGMSADDEKEFIYTFPEDADQESFRGEEAEFHLVVEGVKSRVLPDIDNELATSLGEFEDLDALREEIRSTLVEQSLQAYNDTYDTEIQNDAIEQATITYPPQMLEREVDNVISNLEERVSQQGLDMDLYLKTRSMDIDELRVEVTPVAEQRLKNTLLLIEIAKNEDIQVDPEQVQTQAQSTLNYISQTLTKQEARKLKTRDVYANLLSSITVDTLINSSLERLRDICRGEFEEIADNGEVTEEEADESEKTEAHVEDNEAAIVQEVSVDEQVVDESTTQKEDVVLESVSEHISAKKDDEEPTLETATDSELNAETESVVDD